MRSPIDRQFNLLDSRGNLAFRSLQWAKYDICGVSIQACNSLKLQIVRLKTEMTSRND